MTNNENENDIDIDQQEDFEKEQPQKVSLKETWDSNPLLKIAAVLLAIALLAGGYFMFVGPDQEMNKSIVGAGTSEAKVNVGTEETDAAYKAKIEKQNKEMGKTAENTGSSFMPTPVGPAENTTLAVPATPAAPAGDPLAEWRAKTEAKRVKMESEAPPEEKTEEQPEVVPMVTPIHPQPTMKMDPNAARELAEQMRTIITTQAPAIPNRMTVTNRQSLFTEKVKKDEEERRRNSAGGGNTQLASAGVSGGSAASGGTNGAPAKKKTILTAGTISYAQLINDLNSDVKGPALAQVLSGPFEGGRAIGSFQKQDIYLTLTFTHIIKDGVSYTVNAIALDENTTLTGISSDVDHHYIARIVIPAAAQFITGFATAAAQPQQNQNTVGSVVTTTTSQPTTHEQLMKGVEQAASNASNILTQDAPKEITVKLWHGTTMGLLFTDAVTTDSVEK